LAFWIFAYGSLMADGWEKQHRCLRRCAAILPGHSRSFDKASVESRGTREHPAPTLRIVPSDIDCHGVAFQFHYEQGEDVRSELLRREGKTFPLREKRIQLDDGTSVSALVPIYEGRGIIANKSLTELAEMAIAAKGIRGGGADYVRDIAKCLNQAGVNDPVVTGLLDAIDCLTAKSTNCRSRSQA
jgi:cation transport regulator ChaC